MHLIAGGHFLIEDFVHVIHSRIEIRLADRAVHAWLVHLVEGNFVRWVLVVLKPEADTLGVHQVFLIQALHHSYVRGVAPVEVVGILLAYTLRHLYALVQEVSVFTVFLGVIFARI